METLSRNNIVLAFFMFFALLCHALPVAGQELNKIDEKGKKQGPWAKTDEKGKLKYKGQFKDNLPVGRFEYYYPNGKTKAISNFSDGGKISHTEFFNENGTIKARGKYIEEKRDSIWHFYSDSGKLIRSEGYVNNLLNGASKTFYPKGGLCEITHWTDSIKNGEWKQFFENGMLKSEGHYEKNLLEGKVTNYHSNGKKSGTGKFSNGLKSGWWTYFDENEIPTFYERITGGEIDSLRYWNGTFEETYPNEIPKSKYTYKNGKKHGGFVEYYNQGKWYFEQKTNDNGFPEESVRKLKDSQKSKEGNYWEGELNGTIIYYQKNGKIEKKETYNKGVRISGHE
jgi:antitoxin component YwqK of YwqJK toxin-antitoxin module